MGLDFECLTVPLEAEPVRLIRADAGLWTLAEDQPPFCRPWPGEQLPEISQQLLAVLPEGTGRVHDFFPGRNHEQVEYLLDPAAFRDPQRTWEQREQSPEYRAVRGAEPFADHATSGQGVAWRCSTPAHLSEAVKLIDSLDADTVRRDFSVAEMAELGVYKVHPEEDDDENFTENLRDLRAWAEHCRAVAAQGFGLMIALF
jgi:hypothetical protein